MPVRRGHDSQGPYYAWGRLGARYHYTAGAATSRRIAQKKAARQGRAIAARRSRPGRN
jgi:hypothetical protein